MQTLLLAYGKVTGHGQEEEVHVGGSGEGLGASVVHESAKVFAERRTEHIRFQLLNVNATLTKGPEDLRHATCWCVTLTRDRINW